MISCIILADGISPRTKAPKVVKNGQDHDEELTTAFLTLGDRPVVVHVLDTVRKFFSEITVVVASTKQKSEMDKILRKAELPGARAMADSSKSQSQIARIKAGLESVSGEHVFIVGCDMPFINGVTIFRLMNRVKKDIDCVVPSSGGQYEPLCAIYARRFLDSAEPTDSLTDLITKSRKILVPVFDKHIFFSVSTREDLAQSEKMMKERLEHKGD